MKKLNFIDLLARIVLVWTFVALSFQITMLALNFVNPGLATRIGRELTWRLDGTFSN